METNNIDLSALGIVNSTLRSVKEEYIVITKNQLEVIDSSREGFNFGEKACMIFGNILIGLTAGSLLGIGETTFNPNAMMVIAMFLTGLGLNALGFYLQSKKDSHINKILKKYCQPN